MASTYSYPNAEVFWRIERDKLELVTIDAVDVDNSYESIDESVAQGVMIEYDGPPTLLNVHDKKIHKHELPLRPKAHTALKHYVLQALYEQKQDKSELDIVMMRNHNMKWLRGIAAVDGGKITIKDTPIAIPRYPFRVT